MLAIGEISLQRLNTFSLCGIVTFKPMQLIFLKDLRINSRSSSLQGIPCKDEDLELILKSFKKINCIGLNVTIPHKEKVFNLCSEISPIANKLKAINTLKLNSQ